MFARNDNHFGRSGFTAALIVLLGAVAIAQDDEAPADEDDVIEEIVVIAGKKSGDPVDVEALYEEMLRDRLMLDLDQLRILQEEEEQWRSSRTGTVENPSRIQWGYDPQEELKMRRDSQLSDVTFIPTRPATLFRVGF